MKRKIISLVGRPNVGKSTLFNRLSSRKKALVHNIPGVTRDRKYSDAAIGPIQFTVVDTPGLEESVEGTLESRMMQQTMLSIIEADLVCLIIDNNYGVTKVDKFFAKFIRTYAKKQILLINKAEKQFIHDQEYYKIGFGLPIPISAKHGQGMAYLHDAISEEINTEDNENTSNNTTNNIIKIVITGRPNSGKSTFINSIVGSNRVITGSESGTTRESIEISWQYEEYHMRLIDTAGLRKKSNITESLEIMSASDTMNSIRFANIVVLMLDATIALEHQDLTIANYTIDQGRGLIIVINKWDLIRKKLEYKNEFEYKLQSNLPQVKNISIIYISAHDNRNILSVLNRCINVYQIWNKKLSTSKLNDWLSFALNRHPLPIQKKLGRRVRIKYITQVKIRPPTFKLFTNDPHSITDSYKRYLINALREDFNMPGVPIRMYFIKNNNPYS